MKRILTGLVLALLLPAMVAAQAQPAAGQKLILEFVDGGEFTVTTADKAVLKINAGIFEGDPIPPGATIVTGPSTTAELRIKPNGSILKLANSTTFTVTALATAPKGKNSFALAAGKVRTVAAKGGNYEMRSQTAVCGVRGTDFSFGVAAGAKALLMVADGLVQFDKLDDAGTILGSLPIAAGQAADAFAETFEAFAFDAAQFAEQFGDMGFQKLLETDVPPEAVETDETAAEQPQPPPVPQENLTPAEAAAIMAPDKAAVESGFVKWIREVLGMELGSVTINGATYSKAVIQPNMKLGKVKLGLYLPIIYTSDLFDPSDWYRPAGNDEWSFGRDEFQDGEYLAGGADFARDLALKIKYFEYGTQLEDPFFVKVGNLDDLTLGHGLIMRNYSNSTEFPSVRRVGFNLGVDGAGGGFEALVNDLAAPEIFGLRGYMKPVSGFDLAIGASSVVDIGPASGLVDPDAAGDMMLIGAGVDLDLPIIKTGLLGIRFFADGAATIPYVRTAFSGVDPGLQYQILYSDGQLKNWGASSGFMGNVLFIDWRLEYRYFTGNFRPSFFDATYDRMRGEYAMQYAGYLTNPSTYDATPSVMGVYGEGGFDIMNEKLKITLGYMMPWAPGQSFSEVSDSDEFHARLDVKKGLIPVYDVSGSIAYDRRGLAAALAGGNFKLFDENTIFGGELVVPVPKTPTLDLAIIFQTVPVRDSSTGAIQYADQAAGIPELKPSISIETRFHL
jgi:hypothetical protein